MQEIFIGVFSGILTTVIIFIITIMFQRIFIPWYQGIIYRGVILQGKWIAVNGKDEKDTFTLFLEQVSHKLTGSLTIVQERKASGVLSSTYNVNGETFDGFVVLTLRSIDSRQTGLASIVAKVVGGGKKLETKITFNNMYTENLITIDINFHRPL